MNTEKTDGYIVLSSLSLVLGLGASFLLLAILRVADVDLPPATLLGVSLAALLIVLSDYVVVLLTGTKFMKESIIYIVALLNLFSIIIIVNFPNLPFIKNLSAEEISKYSDTSSLFAFGITIMIMGFKGLSEITNIIKRKNESHQQEVSYLLGRIQELEDTKTQ